MNTTVPLCEASTSTTNTTVIPNEDRQNRAMPWTIEQINSNIAKYPPVTQDAVMRLWKLSFEHKISIGQLAASIGCDPSTISRLFRGIYGAANLGPITDTVLEYLNKAAAVTDELMDIVTDTSVTSEIAEVCRLAWQKRKIGFIFGPAQSGKTTGVKKFAKANPLHPDAPRNPLKAGGRCVYTEMPSGGNYRSLMDVLATAYFRSSKVSGNQIRNTVFNAVQPHDLLIIDEFSRAFNPVSGHVNFTTCEIVREIWDRRRCGLVLVLTDIARDQMQTGKFRDALRQLWFRKVDALQLVRWPKPDDKAATQRYCDDLRLIVRAHGMPGMPGPVLTKCRNVVLNSGITWLTNLFDEAKDIARHHKRAVTWDDFQLVHDIHAQRRGDIDSHDSATEI
jgi:DNA transposition AAA+ family ATPase